MSRILSAVIVLVAVGAGLAAWNWRPPAVPLPPVIAQMGDMDPEVGSLLGELRARIDRAPEDAGRRSEFGMACEANGFIGAAREAYAAAVQLAPADAKSWYRLAIVQGRLGEHSAAVAALRRAAELSPQYAPAWSRLGQALFDSGDTRGADAAFERAAALDSADVRARIGRARIHLHHDDPAAAARVLEQFLEHHPGDRSALQLLGTAYRRLGRMDDAQFALAVGAGGVSTSADPWSDEVARFRRGFATQLKIATGDAQAGRFDRAIPILEGLHQRNPRDASVANHLADVLVAAGRQQEAVAMLTALVDAGHANADTHLVLASAYVRAGDLQRADRHAERAMHLNAPIARAHEIRALIAWRAGRRDEALRLLADGIARDPRNVTLHTWTSLILLEVERPHDAIAAAGEALRREPLNAEALAALAMAQASSGAMNEAVLALARAEQIAPDHPRVREARLKVRGR